MTSARALGDEHDGDDRVDRGERREVPASRFGHSRVIAPDGRIVAKAPGSRQRASLTW